MSGMPVFPRSSTKANSQPTSPFRLTSKPYQGTETILPAPTSPPTSTGYHPPHSPHGDIPPTRCRLSSTTSARRRRLDLEQGGEEGKGKEGS